MKSLYVIALFASIWISWCEGRSAPSTDLVTYNLRGRELLEIFKSNHTNHTDEFSLMALANMSDANLAFTLDLHRQFANDSDVTNVVFSPLSLVYALCMLYAGAKGQTKEQIRQLLHLESLTDEDVHRILHAWLEARGTGTSEETILDMANRLYVGRSSGLDSRYNQLLQDYYNASVRQVDFLKEGDTVRKSINSWVQEKTHGKIRHLLPVPLDPLSSVVIINAIYFKGAWQFKFDPHETSKDYFHVSPTEKMPVAMMTMVNPFPYAYWPDLRARMVGLPYSSARYAMFLLLPDPGVLLETVESALNATALQRMQRELEEVNVTLCLPRFKLEEGGSIRGILAALGVEDLLDSRKADLGGMTPTQDVGLSDIVHKAVLEVSEEGTEAAAASVAMLTRTIDPRNRLVMVNRPFLLYIMDTVTGFVLFWARVAVPHS